MVSKGAENRAVQLVSAASIKPKNVIWLWRKRLPLGTVSLIGGKPGLGKSQLLLLIAAQVTRGTLEGNLHGKPSAVVIASAEDDPESTLVPRLMAAGADMSLVHLVRVRSESDDDVMLTLPDDVQEIGRRAAEVGARLVVIDPLVAYLDSRIDSHRDAALRRALAPLAQMAQEQRLGCVGILHLNKMSGSDPLDRLGGSVAFGAAPRSVLMFGEVDPEDGANERALVQIKNNLAPKASSLLYRVETRYIEGDAGESIETSRCVALGESDVTADDLLRRSTADERSALDEAKEFLEVELAEGPRAQNEIQTAADQAGIAVETLKRAKKKLRVASRKEKKKHGRWFWYPPAKNVEDEHARGPASLDPLEHLDRVDREKEVKDTKGVNSEASKEAAFLADCQRLVDSGEADWVEP